VTWRAPGRGRTGPVPAVAALLAACALAVAGPRDVQAQAGARQVPSQLPSFRAGVEVVSLNVTVTDPTGHYLTGLGEKDFQVYEDGVRQNLTYFDATKLPVALALLLDTSASMEEKLPTAQQAAIGFVRQLRPQDLAEVIDFDSRVQILAPFTDDRQVLDRAILQTSAGGSTALYNAVYIALNELKKVIREHPNDVRRQAIILLSDGDDTSSLVTFDEALDLAKRSETAIYTIGLRSPEGLTIARGGYDESTYVLRQLAAQTGGRAFFPEQLKDLNTVYQQIATELSSQYRLGYTSGNPLRDGAWRRIVVQVDRPDAIVRTKPGYYAPTK